MHYALTSASNVNCRIIRSETDDCDDIEADISDNSDTIALFF